MAVVAAGFAAAVAAGVAVVGAAVVVAVAAGFACRRRCRCRCRRCCRRASSERSFYFPGLDKSPVPENKKVRFSIFAFSDVEFEALRRTC